jgi:hypothetical protein
LKVRLEVDRIAMPKGRGCGVYGASFWGVARGGCQVPQKVQKQGFSAIFVLHNCAKSDPCWQQTGNEPGTATISV